MTRLITALLVGGSFAFASGVALAAGEKNGFVTTTTTVQGGSTNTCNGNPGCTTTTDSANKAGNNQQPTVCDGPAGQCQ
jgi:hypothetical protein